MKQTKRVLAQTICLLAVICLATFAGIMAMAAPPITQYTITNPYENVNWTEYGQYKANFHAHSTNSDGGNLTADMVEDHYAKGFDILSMTDHDYTTASWDTVARGSISAARKAEIQAGVGRGGKPMIEINYTNEQSVVDHINSFWADFNNTSGATMATTIAKVEELGGITHINHAGRYTGGANSNDATSIAASNNPANIKKYVDLFKAYPSCVGMEIINKIDNESKSDRILWDNVLKEMMPESRFVWGFSNDDSHSLNATGYSFNIMLMPELSQVATRKAMETGTFYAVSRVSRLDGINRYYPEGGEVRGDGAAATLYLLEQPTPSISNIVVNQQAGTISISGDDYDTIDWIADGTVIATGNTLKLSDHDAKINSYVRAQLKSTTGIAFTQPFGITREEIDLYTVPAQIAATMTQDPQHSMSITWTTIDTALVNPQVTVTANGESKTFNAVKTVRTVSSSNLRTAANAAITQKAFYTADLTGLTSNTKYTYVCSAQNAAGSETYSSKACTFVTAPEGKDEYTFIYLSDTQSSGVNGKAITANTSVFKEKYPNASFIYIAGDLTDTSTNEGQWEMFFNQKADSYANTGLVNNNFENAMSDYAIAAAQGNHDNNTFANHLTFPADGGTNITYAYTYGSARFIILNFENTATRAAQEAF
ncbi:MAG: fibronectin type III domain-containing protein, partial [Clostridiales bacterium]|nr:fibronectin type III domain-containing protein [Clostridiales bacterium]